MFENEELSAWLEEAVRLFFEQDRENKVKSGVLCVKQEDGNVMTGYYKCNATDMAIFAHNIYADAMIDIVCANADKVRNALQELDDDEGKED